MKIVYDPTPETVALAAKVYALHKQGKNNAEIGRELLKSKSYIGALLDWFKKFKGEEGSTSTS